MVVGVSTGTGRSVQLTVEEEPNPELRLVLTQYQRTEGRTAQGHPHRFSLASANVLVGL